MKLSGRARLAYVAVAAVDAVLAGSTHPLAHRARTLTKPLLMPLLSTSLASSATTSLASRAPTSTLRTPVLAAQAAGWVGDVTLMSQRRAPFLIGTAGFALGHAAYIEGFHRLRNRSSSVYDEGPARSLAALWAVSGPALGVAARREQMGLPVTVYSAVLTAMVISATRLSPEVPPSVRRFAAAGALLFLASDTTLGVRKFVLSDPPPAMESVMMATYTAGQLLLSEAAARA